MRNPLKHRFLRELKEDFGKYFVILVMLVLTIGFVSGFLVADGSMITAYEEGFEKYNIEDGHFRLNRRANSMQRDAIGEMGIEIYENFYIEEALTNESILRIYKNREIVNLVCLMEGTLPVNADEIAIDRMYADNNGLVPGDTISSDTRTWTVTGLVALPDYSCLFSSNQDSMFDAIKFGVAVVTKEAFDTFEKKELYWNYAWKYDQKPLNESEEQELSEELMKALISEVTLEDYVPCYQNQAIQFTGDDIGKDRVMMIALLYIIIVIMAFVFGIIISNTINKEANVIGTLRASGYTKGELIRHYMTMPMLITAIGASIGNVLGYSTFKDVCADMYYGSYSLPTYVTIWNAEAFVLTTIVPVCMMVVINYLTLRRKLKLSPLKFIRRDLNQRKQKRVFPLSPVFPFFGRFRLRVIFQNRNNYITLFAGILFANLLLMFGLIFPSVLDHYQQDISRNMISKYQYMLQIPYSAMDEEHKLESMFSMMMFQMEVETKNEDAEKFSAYSLNTLDGKSKSEGVMLYGVEPDSRYVSLETEGAEVSISSAYLQKFGVEPGDTIVLKELYENEQYEFKVGAVYDYNAAIAVFMDIDELNRVFELGDDYFSGYFSDSEITDIDEEYIASVVDIDALTKVSRQLDVSMGSMMNLVQAFAIMIFVVLVYLLSKTIIEKNAHSISMTKILGYTNGEIGRLYIVSTTLMVIVFLLVSLPIETWIMEMLFRIIMCNMTGWISFYMDPMIYVKMFVMGLGSYSIVALIELRKIKKVPMDEALKHVE